MGKNQNNTYKNLLNNKKPKINIAKLSRTGIDQPFMRDRPRFKDTCREFEPIHQFNPALAEELSR
jgi:hypothetical protein